MIRLSFISEAFLKLRYALSELRTVSPGRKLYRQMLGNAKYTFRIIGERVSRGTYGFDHDAVRSSRSVGEVVAALPMTDPRHYVDNMDEYNRWINEEGMHASDVVLTSGTSGRPKIVTYSRHDSYRDLLVIARGLKLSYPDIELRRLLFLLELATAYPAASSALTSHVSSGIGVVSIPTYLKETLDDVVRYVNRFFADRGLTFLGYPSQLLNVTPSKFVELDPGEIGVHALAPNGEVLTRGAKDALRRIYRPDHIVGIYGSTETRIIGLDKDDVYVVHGDRSLIAVRRRDGSIGVDGEGELLVTPLYRPGETPGTIIPMYRLGDLAKVEFDEGMYYLHSLRRIDDEFFIGASNFNPALMASIVEGELIQRGVRSPQVFFILSQNPETKLITSLNVIASSEKGRDNRLVEETVRRALDKYSEVVAFAKAGTIDLGIRTASSVGEVVEEYPTLVQRSYVKGGKYAVIEAP